MAIVLGILGKESMDKVKVSESDSQYGVTIYIRGPRELMGPLIGKGGDMAKSIRHIVNAAARRLQKKCLVDIDHIQEAGTPTEK